MNNDADTSNSKDTVLGTVASSQQCSPQAGLVRFDGENSEKHENFQNISTAVPTRIRARDILPGFWERPSVAPARLLDARGPVDTHIESAHNI
jgi:hypothetical protein